MPILQRLGPDRADSAGHKMVVSAELREIDVSEVATHNDEGSAWIIMNDVVYDVTKFLMEHPGGEEVILQQAGRDATDAFNEVGHSADAIEMASFTHGINYHHCGTGTTQ
jgi:cytochrome b involved in lipid metabolism